MLLSTKVSSVVHIYNKEIYCCTCYEHCYANNKNNMSVSYFQFQCIYTYFRIRQTWDLKLISKSIIIIISIYLAMEFIQRHFKVTTQRRCRPRPGENRSFKEFVKRAGQIPWKRADFRWVTIPNRGTHNRKWIICVSFMNWQYTCRPTIYDNLYHNSLHTEMNKTAMVCSMDSDTKYE